MKTLLDPDNALADGLAAIRQQFQIPAAFPADVMQAAEEAAQKPFSEHRDRSAEPFVTLDPASSTDLDQAFAIERSGADLILHYAIADVAWFVDDGGVIDTEAWRRGTTQYLPDGKAGLYPPCLSEDAASLLPDGPRPAVVFTVRVDPDGAVKLDGAERAVIRSRAKRAYDAVRDSDLPDGFRELSDRIKIAEGKRGASRVDPPEQEVGRTSDGAYELSFRARLESEARNAALSLATNLAVADALLARATGLFRVMPPPDSRAVKRLRFTAAALKLSWPSNATLAQFERGLNPDDPHHAAFMLAIRRVGNGASYEPYWPGIVPWHAAMAASYAHATAPLRRLADRYVVRAALAIARGEPVPDVVTEAFEKLPPVMARADALGNQIERAVIDLAEAVILRDRVGAIFPAIVTEATEKGARIQLCDLPVAATVPANGVGPGDRIDVELLSVDLQKRILTFRHASSALAL